MRGDLTDLQIKNILSSQALGRLACVDGKQPYIVPLTYVYDGDYIYGQTNTGKKLDILRKNPSICFEVDVMTDMANWQCVLVYGKFEELKNEPDGVARKTLHNKLFSLMTSSAVHSHEHNVTNTIDDSNRIKTVLFRLVIKKITGRFEKK